MTIQKACSCTSAVPSLSPCGTGTTQAALFANVPLLTEILSYHILPIVPFIETAWTTPFFLPGTVLATSIPGRTIHVAPPTSASPTLVGGIGGTGTARVVSPDFEPCKVRSGGALIAYLQSEIHVLKSCK